MAERGDVGVTIDVSKMPVREEGMTPYEILLSESQERMLVVAERGHEEQVRAILAKWDLNAEVIGEVIADPVYRVTEGERVVAEFPGSRLVTDCPVYTPEARESEEVRALRTRDVHAIPERPEERDAVWTLERLLSSPTIASKRWVYRQYDHMVRTNTLVLPGMGAGVVRVKGTPRALAMSVDCNGRFVYLDPYRGAQLAVAEAARNVACAGALPIGATNCLNFGNPEKPDIMWQFARAVEGMGAACRALDIPITGGNVSLYNETDGRAVLPTPVLGVVGVIEDASKVVRRTFRSNGDAVILLGETYDELGGSEYLKIVHGLIRGVPPAIDLRREAALYRVLLEGVSAGLIRSAQDCSEGGFAITLAECCIGTGLGTQVDIPAVPSIAADSFTDIVTLFSESASRVIVSAGPEAEAALVSLAARHHVPARTIGRVRGTRMQVAINGRSVIDESLADVERTWNTAIECYFEPARAIA
jgi:phosphoribosylformylglycinamidine synthase